MEMKDGRKVQKESIIWSGGCMTRASKKRDVQTREAVFEACRQKDKSTT
jgi:hypothetical protein